MTNYTITQSRKGGRKRAQLSALHDDAIIHRLLDDGYATQETYQVLARETAKVVTALRRWDTDIDISSVTSAQADELVERAEEDYEARREARAGRWSDLELRGDEQRAVEWIALMKRVRYVAIVTAALLPRRVQS
jgi:hypothetical protein